MVRHTSGLSVLVGSTSPLAAELLTETLVQRVLPMLQLNFGWLLVDAAADVSELLATSHFRSAHNDVVHVNLNQRYRGREVFGAHATVSVAASGGTAQGYAGPSRDAPRYQSNCGERPSTVEADRTSCESRPETSQLRRRKVASSPCTQSFAAGQCGCHRSS